MPASNDQPRQWLSVRDVATYLGLKPSTIYAYIAERRIPYHKVPRSQLVRFKREEIDQWMESGRVTTQDGYLTQHQDKE